MKITLIGAISVIAFASNLAIADFESDSKHMMLDTLVAGGAAYTGYVGLEAHYSETGKALRTEKKLLKKAGPLTTMEEGALREAQYVLSKKSSLVKVVTKVLGSRLVRWGSWGTMAVAATDQIVVVYSPKITRNKQQTAEEQSRAVVAAQ